MAGSETAKRDMTMDTLRILACLMVIAMHVLAAGKVAVPFGGAGWNLILALNCCVHFAVPLFFMLSGAFSKVSTGRQAAKKSIYYFIVFVLSALFYYVLGIYLGGGNISFWDAVYSLINYKYHLWFLLNMITVTLLSPFLNKLSGKDMKYALILTLVFIIGFKNLSYAFSGKEPVMMGADLLGGLIPSGLLFCGYYLAGRLIYENREELKSKKIPALIVLIPTTAASFFINRYVCLKTMSIDERFLDNYSIFVFVQCICTFIVFATKKEPAKSGKLVSRLVPLCFGVYIIHVAFVDILSSKGFTPAGIGITGQDSALSCFALILLEMAIVTVASVVAAIPLRYLGRAVKRLFRLN